MRDEHDVRVADQRVEQTMKEVEEYKCVAIQSPERLEEPGPMTQR